MPRDIEPPTHEQATEPTGFHGSFDDNVSIDAAMTRLIRSLGLPGASFSPMSDRDLAHCNQMIQQLYPGGEPDLSDEQLDRMAADMREAM